MKKLPIGISTFSEIIEEGYIYVDKTQFIHKMTNTGKPYFLSRPRRFGKSLLISTLEELFKGNKELFKGLYIYDKWDWSDKYPIIHLDFGNRTSTNPEELKLSLNKFLNDTAKDNKVELEDIDLIADKFEELIKKIYKKTGKKVVVLIDEYDMPILDQISDLEVSTKNRDILASFYKVLKSNDKYLRFVFLTGVTKFVGTSIFSGLNNLNDITLSDDFADICGYSQKDLENYFSDHIQRLSKKYEKTEESIICEIKKWYNGYSWDGENFLYNPQSILSLFNKNKFKNYWFSTGTPTFLIKLLKNRDDLKKALEETTVTEEISNSFEPENIPTIPLMFQTGYLTIKKTELIDLRHLYTLAVPNKEVNESIINQLLNIYTDYPLVEIENLRIQMYKNFLKKDSKGLNSNLSEMLANIPYQLHTNKESYYHSLFLLWIHLLGFKIDGEVTTNKGRMDATLLIDNKAFIIEIKFGKSKKQLDNLIKTALTQIKDKKYYEKYSSYDITLLAIAFTEKETKCKFEIV